MILRKKDVVKHAAEDWVSKWTAAIINSAVMLKDKTRKLCQETLDLFVGECTHLYTYPFVHHRLVILFWNTYQKVLI